MVTIAHQNFFFFTSVDLGAGTTIGLSAPTNNYTKDGADGIDDGVVGIGSNIYFTSGTYGSPTGLLNNYVVIGHTANGVIVAYLTEASNGYLLSTTGYTHGTTLTINTTSPYTFCFLGGTMIATPSGEVPVEYLQIGDLVTTADGRAVAVKWLGEQRIKNTMFTDHTKAPVCIAAGALGEGLPHSDLFISADHGMMIDGMVVNAGALVNGTTIRFVPMAEMPAEFTYYHVETEAHDEILANGAAAETFIDYVGRRDFDNYQEYIDLYGAERIIPEMKRPRISAQRQLPEALFARFGIPSYDARIEAEMEALDARLAQSESPDWAAITDQPGTRITAKRDAA